MPTLAETLLTAQNRPVLVRDCDQLIHDEVAAKKGVTGLAIKAAFKTVTTVKKGIIPDVVDALLDEFVAQLEPFYAEFLTSPAESSAGAPRQIRPYVIQHADRIADALLRITDQRADQSRHTTLVKAYRKLRPQGQKQVVEAMPRIGEMLAKHGL